MIRGLMLSGAAVIALSSMAVAPAHAEGGIFDNLTGSVAITSDYRYRGISQSDEEAALQASLEWSHDSGVYLGAWASSVEFLDAPRDTWAEIDLYVGYAAALSEQTTWNVQATYYWYPDSSIPAGPDYDYWEFAAGIQHTIDKITLSGTAAYTPDNFAGTGDGFYVGGGAAYQILDWLSADAGVGYQWIDDESTFGVPDYMNWTVGVTATLDILSIDVRYIDTDVELGDGLEGGGAVGATSAEWSDDTVVATISLNF